ncbi:hypothetical protein CDSM653_02347 [Caldanaerobacter subterraneus subsp. pacificus DSM 12653]|uniref:Uncharacterized protein n=1 Tax=Caldanaerobacter subterraneus subsp. pacificus DSM 12653 TaxID=391606 RepID=A0A0F5PLE4_9THEO|nr:hypothetical protein CDSM653_02390 [Caldanaerobacter subterraneus subsp. pacificus DSM 12653]KKC28627.1 hypothetical protein CDSM653_02394 [Caldanaerobacter subterraneus subsp. pacificus DSM 12653]KKC28659.1 hypothetical protein CDSM653_02347 [Caldanaerobacter subterraneus subsp. pacificus DSM 12653]
MMKDIKLWKMFLAYLRGIETMQPGDKAVVFRLVFSLPKRD